MLALDAPGRGLDGVGGLQCHDPPSQRSGVEGRPRMMTRGGSSENFGLSGTVVVRVGDTGLSSLWEVAYESKRLRPPPQSLFDLLALRLGPRVGVIGRHAKAVAGRRLVAKGDLTDERINVRVLQEGGEGVTPRLRTGRFGVADDPGDADERGTDSVGLDRPSVAPDSAGKPQHLGP